MKYVFFFLIFISCGRNVDSHNDLFNFSREDIRQEIIDTVEKISDDNIIMSSAIGPGGIKPEQYERFEFLCENAYEKELIELTDYPNGVVRGYSFWALAKLRSDSLEKVILDHIQDTDTISTQFGCMLFSYPLIDFMIEVVTPGRIDIDCQKFDLEKRVELRKLRNNSEPLD